MFSELGLQKEKMSSCVLFLPPWEKLPRLLGLFGFWKGHGPHLRILLRPILWVTWKAANFKWDLEKERVPQQAQGAT